MLGKCINHIINKQDFYLEYQVENNSIQIVDISIHKYTECTNKRATVVGVLTISLSDNQIINLLFKRNK